MASNTQKPKKRIRLNSREINVVSVIAQQTALPHEYLLRFAKESNVSADAYSVIRSLLNDASKEKPVAKVAAKKTSKKTAKVVRKRPAAKRASRTTEVAGDFSKWASALK